jgi:hypothetical protein
MLGPNFLQDSVLRHTEDEVATQQGCCWGWMHTQMTSAITSRLALRDQKWPFRLQAQRV